MEAVIKKAFSVAEGMVTLLITSVALGAAVPMITKQIKQNNYNNFQYTKIETELKDLRTQIQELSSSIKQQENNEQNETITSGAIVFFETDCLDKTNWIDMSEKYAGRYIRIAGSYDICDKDGENESGECAGNKKTITLTSNTTQGEALKRIIGTLPGQDAGVSYYTKDNYVKKLQEYGVLSGAFDYIQSSELKNKNTPYSFPSNWNSLYWLDNKAYAKIFYNSNKYIMYTDPSILSVTMSTGSPEWFINSIDTKRVAPTDTNADEIRPKTIILKACKHK